MFLLIGISFEKIWLPEVATLRGLFLMLLGDMVDVIPRDRCPDIVLVAVVLDRIPVW
jgi:hypothetical protein